MTTGAQLRADAHIHLFRDGYRGLYGRSPTGGDELDNYEGVRSVHRIAKALVIGYEGQARYQGNNSYLSSLAATHEWIAPVAYLPCSPPPTAEQLWQLWREHFVGLSLYLLDPASGSEWARWPASIWAELNARRAVISLNCVPGAATTAAPAIERVEGASVLLSHLGLPGHVGSLDKERLRELLAPILRLSRFPHVGVKLSGLYAIADPPHAYPFRDATLVIGQVLDAFGPGRVSWGSDYPCCLDAVSFAQAVDLPVLRDLDTDERTAVNGRNLLRLLELPKG